jgi:hypothetical protein
MKNDALEKVFKLSRQPARQWLHRRFTAQASIAIALFLRAVLGESVNRRLEAVPEPLATGKLMETSHAFTRSAADHLIDRELHSHCCKL